MSNTIFELERFLRWLGNLSAAEKLQHSAEISEAALAFADLLEPLSDAAEDDSEPGE